MRSLWVIVTLAVVSSPAVAQRGYVPKSSRADSLRGSFTSPSRAWWDVTFYDLHVAINPRDSTIVGRNGIGYRVLRPASELQIDLMEPLQVDSMIQDGRAVRFRREGAAFFATLTSPQRVGDRKTITVYYRGRPKIAPNPPWDGGFTWARDSLGRPWIVTTDQGMGASVWWPNKDTQADEPDSQRVALTVPDPMIDVSNGRLRRTTRNPNGTTTYEWFVTNPINNYGIAVAAGSYAHWSEVYDGLNGKLSLDFWPLDYNLEKARRQWVQVRPMLQCFEHWFGPYPWYEDGFKLVETPHPGMEHQSAVAYGNYFENGYRRRDASGTGHGLKWDFIIVHESAHEWFANNITAKDNADMWVHESFANYAEGIYTECLLGKQAASEYIIGNRRGIRNDRPIIPPYGVNEQGSGDMYPKGGEMLHTIRQIVDNDEKWRGILVGLNKTFWHQTVMGKQVEDYISAQAGVNLGKVFDQYLRTVMIPTFEYWIEDDTLSYRWTTVVPGFDMPLKVALDGAQFTVIRPTEAWQRVPVKFARPEDLKVDSNFYVIPKAASAPPLPVCYSIRVGPWARVQGMDLPIVITLPPVIVLDTVPIVPRPAAPGPEFRLLRPQITGMSVNPRATTRWAYTGDSLFLQWSNGYGGFIVRSKQQQDSLFGTASAVTDNGDLSQSPLTGQRVTCPPQ